MNALHCTKLHKLVNKIWHFTCAYISYNNQQLPRRIYHTQSTANKYNVCSYIDPQAGADSQILYIFVCWKSAEKKLAGQRIGHWVFLCQKSARKVQISKSFTQTQHCDLANPNIN